MRMKGDNKHVYLTRTSTLFSKQVYGATHLFRGGSLPKPVIKAEKYLFRQVSIMSAAEDTNSIGRLEPQLHSIFCHMRVPGDEYVYCAEGALLASLENYTDDGPEDRSPVVLLGEDGSGKSALLANFVERRTRHNGRSNRNDFMFFHAVGCSRQSMNVNSLLRRLMNALKEHFELTRNVPLDEDRLSWDLPLFLEQAAKKGKIIIIIDGLQRLTSNSESGTGLTWLPLNFPSNVRLIASSSAPASYFREAQEGGNTPRKPRLLVELERRNWSIMKVTNMTSKLSTQIVDEYIKRTVQMDAVGLTHGAFLTDVVAPRDFAGLLLFESQLDALVSHPQATKPIFLGVVMRMLRFCTTKGYSLWHLFDRWMQCEELEDLLHDVLTVTELGYFPTAKKIKFSHDQALVHGGKEALAKVYPWHPTFSDKIHSAQPDMNSEDEFALDFQGSNNSIRGKAMIAAAVATAGQFGTLQTRGHAKSRENRTDAIGVGEKGTIIASMGDQRWRQTSEDADAHLNLAHIEMTKDLLSHVEYAQKFARNENSKKTEGEASTSYVHILMKNIDEFVANNQGDSTFTRSATTHVDDEEDDEDYETLEGTGTLEEGNSLGDDEDMNKSRELASPTPQDDQHHSTEDDLLDFPPLSAGVPVSVGSATTTGVTGGTMSPPGTGSGKRNSRQHHHHHHKHTKESIEHLPQYMLGGNEVQGFHQVLGDALALLYVARHGLTENELWSILSSVNEEKVNASNVRTVDDDVRILVSVCHGYRGQLEDMFRTHDSHKLGFLKRTPMLACFRKVNPQFDRSDLQLLLTTTGTHEDDKGLVDYMDFLRKLEKAERSIKVKDNKSKLHDPRNSIVDLLDEGSALTALGSLHSSSLDGEDEGSKVPSGTKKHSALGPVMEAALLEFLCAFGVLYSAANHVLVLPFDSQAMRQVVYDRYIEPSKTARMAAAAQESEEMPTDPGEVQDSTVSNQSVVSTVNGPLGEGHIKGGLDFWHSKLINYFQKLPITLRRCEELLWHLKICHRWYSLKDSTADLQTFDIMFNGELRDEYMQYWVLLTEGNLYTSDNAENRATLDKTASENQKILVELDTAAALGLTEKEARKAMLKSQIRCFDVVEEFHKALDSWIGYTHPNIQSMAMRVDQIASFMAEFSRKCSIPPTFLRLPLQDEVLALEFNCKFKELEIPDLTEDEDHGPEAMEAHEKAKSTRKHRLYFYRRWMWTQFPLLALWHVIGLARTEAGSQLNSTADGTDLALTDGDGSNLAIESSKIIADQTFMRNFVIKKSDPTKPPIYQVNKTRQDAMVKSVMTPVAEVIALANITKYFAEKAENEVARPAGKFKRTISEDKELFKTIPHAYSSIRSSKRDTKFPTVDAMLKAKEADKEGSELLTPQAIARIGASVDDFGGGAVAEIRRLQEEEDLLDMNSRRAKAIFGSKDEIEYAKELERMGRLRTLADRTHEKRRKKSNDLELVRKAFISREEEDEYVLAGLASGESAIVHLEARLVALKQALAETRRLNDQFQKLIRFLSRSPPYNDQHLASLEQELSLARQQLADLMSFRHKLYVETDQQGFTRRTNLKNKVAQYKKLRKDLSNKFVHAKKTYEQTKETMDLEERVKEEKYNMGLAYESVAENDALLLSIQAGVAAGSKEEPEDPKKLSTILSVADDEGTTDAKVRQAQMSLEFLLRTTGSSSEGEFLDRFNDSMALTTTLRNQQTMTEARITLLRQEQDEMHEEVSALTGYGDGSENQNLDMATRHFESKIFDAEIRLAHSTRQAESAAIVINEIRSGVNHIMNTLHQNAKMLHNLPTGNPPKITKEEDIIRTLSWCEERVLAINEALVLDTGAKPAGASDTTGKMLQHRQTDHAAAVIAMVAKSPLKSKKKKQTKQKKGQKNISHSIIDFSEENAQITSPRNNLVLCADNVPIVFDEKIAEVIQKQDAYMDLLERKSKLSGNRDSTVGVSKFLSDALSTHDAREALRKANRLANKIQGKSAGYGLALEDLLKNKGPELLESKPEATHSKNSIELFKLDFNVPSRDELKEKTASKLRKSERIGTDGNEEKVATGTETA